MLLSSEATTPTMATMSEVVMTKKELLEHLITNKAKHDVVLATAIAGYWDMAKTRMKEKQDSFDEQIKLIQEDVQREFDRINTKIDKKEKLPNHLTINAIRIDTNLGLTFPQDHTQDYERAIRMMESSVFEQVRLSAVEYDAFVLNNWEWKEKFLEVNGAYFDNAVKKQMLTGCAGSGMMFSGLSPSKAEAYNAVYRRGEATTLAAYTQGGANLSNSF